jgi:uncharacterized metal-binding protein
MAAFAILFFPYLWSLVVSQDLDDPKKRWAWIKWVQLRFMNV